MASSQPPSKPSSRSPSKTPSFSAVIITYDGDKDKAEIHRAGPKDLRELERRASRGGDPESRRTSRDPESRRTSRDPESRRTSRDQEGHRSSKPPSRRPSEERVSRQAPAAAAAVVAAQVARGPSPVPGAAVKQTSPEMVHYPPPGMAFLLELQKCHLFLCIQDTSPHSRSQ